MRFFLLRWILANAAAAAVGWALGEFAAATLGEIYGPLIGFTVGVFIFRGVLYFAQKRALGVYAEIREVARFWSLMRLVLEIFSFILVEGFIVTNNTPNWGMVGVIYFVVSDTLIWFLLGLSLTIFRRGDAMLKFLLAILVGIVGSFAGSLLMSAFLVAALETQKILGGTLGWAAAGMTAGSLTGLLSGVAILLTLRGLNRNNAVIDGRATNTFRQAQ